MDILTKQSQTADNGMSSNMGIGHGLRTPYRKITSMSQNTTKVLSFGQIFLVQEKWGMGFRTWNVGSLWVRFTENSTKKLNET